MNTQTVALKEAYDDVPYKSSSFPLSHPSHLQALARLHGLETPDIERCRVLEIGCALGQNLMPLAQMLKGSQFVGIDLSERQIREGNQLAISAQLDNVILKVCDLTQFEDERPFDYIIAHGIYSWVPPDVRDHLLRIIRRSLSATGVGYVSYNTLPGGFLKQACRDIMLMFCQTTSAHQERSIKARRMLQLLQSLPAKASPAIDALREEARKIAAWPDHLIFHDELEATNDPVYFRDFVAHLSRHDLYHLASVIPPLAQFEHLSTTLQQELAGPLSNFAEQEQYVDFFAMRTFRASLLTRFPLDENPRLRTESFTQIFYAGWLTETQLPGGGQGVKWKFTSRITGTSIDTDSAITAEILRAISQRWPTDIDFYDLRNQIESKIKLPANLDQLTHEITSTLISLYRRGMLSIASRPSRATASLGEKPHATRLALLQAESGHGVVNLRHQEIQLTKQQREVLLKLDGSQTIEQLIKLPEKTSSAMQATAIPMTSDSQVIDVTATLKQLANQCLIVA